MGIRVILADDHPLVREGLRSVIEHQASDITVVGEAADGRELLDLAATVVADVYVLDISMPRLNGIQTTARLLEAQPAARVIALSMHDTRTFVEQALHSGARGYVVKDSATDDVVEAIHEVYRGRCYLSPRISHYVVEGFLAGRSDAADSPPPPLTSREIEILQLLAEGRSNKEIARGIDRSIHTVHVHRTNIMRKLDLHSQAELIRYAIREGIADL